MDVLTTLRESQPVVGCSYSKLRKLARSGALPYRKLGSTWVIPRSELYRELGLEPPGEGGDEEEVRVPPTAK